MEILEEEKPPTVSLIASRLGITRQSAHKMFRRHPGLMPWINTHINRAAACYTGSVMRKMAFLGMRGSHHCAEVYFKAISGAYLPRAGGPGSNLDPNADAVPGSVNVNATVNLLCPRPEYPAGSIVQAPTTRLPPPHLPPGAVITQLTAGVSK